MTSPRRFSGLLLALSLASSLSAVAQQAPTVSLGIFKGSTDIGTTRMGSTLFDGPTASYRVTGGGADMWGAADDFHFTWTRLSGNAELTADVQITGNSIAPLEKAVLIFRQSLDPDSAYADVAIHGDGHITLQYRVADAGKTEDLTAPVKGSKRLRIERKGDRFTAYVLGDNNQLTPFASYRVPLRGPVYVGIGVCAHDSNGLASATFSNITLGPSPIPRP